MRFAQIAKLILLCYLMHLCCIILLPSVVKSSISQQSHQGLPDENSEIPVPIEVSWEIAKISDTDLKSYVTVAQMLLSDSIFECRSSECNLNEFISSRDLLTSIHRLQI